MDFLRPNNRETLKRAARERERRRERARGANDTGVKGRAVVRERERPGICGI